MFETSVVRYVRLLLQSLQQTDLSLRPLIEQAEAGRTITYIDTGQIENQRITERRVLGRNAERQTRLTIRIARFVITLLVLVSSRCGSRARGNHVHIFKADVDDVHTRRVSTGGFDVDSHDIVHIASRKISVTPIRFAVFSHPTQLRRFSGFVSEP